MKTLKNTDKTKGSNCTYREGSYTAIPTISHIPLFHTTKLFNNILLSFQPWFSFFFDIISTLEDTF